MQTVKRVSSADLVRFALEHHESRMVDMVKRKYGSEGWLTFMVNDVFVPLHELHEGTTRILHAQITDAAQQLRQIMNEKVHGVKVLNLYNVSTGAFVLRHTLTHKMHPYSTHWRNEAGELTDGHFFSHLIDAEKDFDRRVTSWHSVNKTEG